MKILRINRLRLFHVAGILMLCNLASLAQNVGVNKTNPTEALDVNGNIQLNGSIMPNGNPGQNGQVLASTGGGLQWIDALASGYKHFRSYLNTGISASSFIWQKPAGVTEIMIEAWAGGAGGSGGGGGGGGGYATIVLDVTDISQINMNIGNGGISSGALNGASGGNTVISWVQGASASITIPGGLGGTNTRAGGYSDNFITTNIPSNVSLFTLPGNPGEPIKTYYSQNTSSTYLAVIDGGRGGGTYKHYSNGGAGTNYAVTAANNQFVLNQAANAGTPGGGAGSSYRPGSVAQNAHRGGGGMVIIRW